MNDDLRAENDRLREALPFYADRERWDEFAHDERASSFDRNFGSDFGDDKGAKARAALGEREA